ncbi:Uncharacterised protein [Vibrio cholerae]|nr:Uncharacterised protein [Vibrio cholerae]
MVKVLSLNFDDLIRAQTFNSLQAFPMEFHVVHIAFLIDPFISMNTKTIHGSIACRCT